MSAYKEVVGASIRALLFSKYWAQKYIGGSSKGEYKKVVTASRKFRGFAPR